MDSVVAAAAPQKKRGRKPAVPGAEKKKSKKTSVVKKLRLLSLLSNIKSVSLLGKVSLRGSAQHVMQSLHTELALRIVRGASMLAEANGSSTLTSKHIRAAAGILIDDCEFRETVFTNVEKKITHFLSLPKPPKKSRPFPGKKAKPAPVAEAAPAVAAAKPVAAAPAPAPQKTTISATPASQSIMSKLLG